MTIANKKQKHHVFQIGDLVLLRIEKRRLKSIDHCPLIKLGPHYYGSFKVIAKINVAAYRLKLPPHWHIRNSFHIHLLKLLKGTPLSHPVYNDPPLLKEQQEF